MATETATPDPKKLTAAPARRILSSIRNATVSGTGSDFEIECANRSTMGKVNKALKAAGFSPLGGFKTGYGSWILSPGYRSMGGWGDKSSVWHY